MLRFSMKMICCCQFTLELVLGYRRMPKEQVDEVLLNHIKTKQSEDVLMTMHNLSTARTLAPAAVLLSTRPILSQEHGSNLSTSDPKQPRCLTSHPTIAMWPTRQQKFYCERLPASNYDLYLPQNLEPCPKEIIMIAKVIIYNKMEGLKNERETILKREELALQHSEIELVSRSSNSSSFSNNSSISSNGMQEESSQNYMEGQQYTIFEQQQLEMMLTNSVIEVESGRIGTMDEVNTGQENCQGDRSLNYITRKMIETKMFGELKLYSSDLETIAGNLCFARYSYR